MERRRFLGWVGVGFLASSLPVVIAACEGDKGEPQAQQGDSDSSASNAPREDGFQEVGTVEELEQKGKIKYAAADVMVVRDPDTKELSAVNLKCTHQGCSVDWDTEANGFACPCHGSKFAVDGSVTNPPADKPLTTYEAKEEEGSVLVKVI